LIGRLLDLGRRSPTIFRHAHSSARTLGDFLFAPARLRLNHLEHVLMICAHHMWGQDATKVTAIQLVALGMARSKLFHIASAEKSEGTTRLCCARRVCVGRTDMQITALQHQPKRLVSKSSGTFVQLQPRRGLVHQARTDRTTADLEPPTSVLRFCACVRREFQLAQECCGLGEQYFARPGRESVRVPLPRAILALVVSLELLLWLAPCPASQ
jgi:hypothetical protein